MVSRAMKVSCGKVKSEAESDGEASAMGREGPWTCGANGSDDAQLSHLVGLTEL